MRTFALTLATTILMLLATSAFADSILLLSGERYEGEIVFKDNNWVIIKLAVTNERKAVSRNSIRDIQFAPSTPSSTPAASVPPTPPATLEQPIAPAAQSADDAQDAPAQSPLHVLQPLPPLPADAHRAIPTNNTTAPHSEDAFLAWVLDHIQITASTTFSDVTTDSPGQTYIGNRLRQWCDLAYTPQTRIDISLFSGVQLPFLRVMRHGKTLLSESPVLAHYTIDVNGSRFKGRVATNASDSTPSTWEHWSDVRQRLPQHEATNLRDLTLEISVDGRNTVVLVVQPRGEARPGQPPWDAKGWAPHRRDSVYSTIPEYRSPCSVMLQHNGTVLDVSPTSRAVASFLLLSYSYDTGATRIPASRISGTLTPSFAHFKATSSRSSYVASSKCPQCGGSGVVSEAYVIPPQVLPSPGNLPPFRVPEQRGTRRAICPACAGNGKGPDGLASVREDEIEYALSVEFRLESVPFPNGSLFMVDKADNDGRQSFAPSACGQIGSDGVVKWSAKDVSKRNWEATGNSVDDAAQLEKFKYERFQELVRGMTGAHRIVVLTPNRSIQVYEFEEPRFDGLSPAVLSLLLARPRFYFDVSEEAFRAAHADASGK